MSQSRRARPLEPEAPSRRSGFALAGAGDEANA